MTNRSANETKGRRIRRGFSVVETVVAAGILSLAAGFATKSLSTTRMSGAVEDRVDALQDARQVFMKLTAELQRGREIDSPAAYASADAVEFFNDRHERVRYELREGSRERKGRARAGRTLVRVVGGVEKTVASGLERAVFHRGGRHMVTISLGFKPIGRSAKGRSFTTTLALRNKVH